MKVQHLLGVAGIVMVSQLAQAEIQKPDPKVLAMTEAVVAYCTKADPSAAAKQKDSLRQITRGASREKLASIRKSSAYRQARESMDEFLGKVDEHNAGKVCSRNLAQSR